MTYLNRLKQKISEETPKCEATKGTEATFVPFVASCPASFCQISVANDSITDPAAEARRRRVLAMLTDNPVVRLAVVCDGYGDPVPVAVAIRDKGTCEVLIPAVRFDPLALLELAATHGDTLH